MQDIINLMVLNVPNPENETRHQKNLKTLVDVCNDLLSQIVSYIGSTNAITKDGAPEPEVSSYSIMFPNDSIAKTEVISQLLFLLTEILNIAENLKTITEQKPLLPEADKDLSITRNLSRRRTIGDKATPEEVAIQRSISLTEKCNTCEKAEEIVSPKLILDL
jgi:hypothetical protein